MSIAAFLSHPTISYIVAHGEEFPLHFKDLFAYMFKHTATLPPIIEVFRCVYKSFTVVAFILAVVSDHSVRCELSACTGLGD